MIANKKITRGLEIAILWSTLAFSLTPNTLWAIQRWNVNEYVGSTYFHTSIHQIMVDTKRDASLRIMVMGYADETSNSKKNMEIAKQRATSVATLAAKISKTPISQFKIYGFDSKRLSRPSHKRNTVDILLSQNPEQFIASLSLKPTAFKQVTPALKSTSSINLHVTQKKSPTSIHLGLGLTSLSRKTSQTGIHIGFNPMPPIQIQFLSYVDLKPSKIPKHDDKVITKFDVWQSSQAPLSHGSLLFSYQHTATTDYTGTGVNIQNMLSQQTVSFLDASIRVNPKANRLWETRKTQIQLGLGLWSHHFFNQFSYIVQQGQDSWQISQGFDLKTTFYFEKQNEGYTR